MLESDYAIGFFDVEQAENLPPWFEL